jgi:hypothetical protein
VIARECIDTATRLLAIPPARRVLTKMNDDEIPLPMGRYPDELPIQIAALLQRRIARQRPSPVPLDRFNDATQDTDAVDRTYLWEQPQLALAIGVQAPPAPTETMPLVVGETIADRPDRSTRTFLTRQPLIALRREQPDRTLRGDAHHPNRLELLIVEPNRGHELTIRKGCDGKARDFAARRA